MTRTRDGGKARSPWWVIYDSAGGAAFLGFSLALQVALAVNRLVGPGSTRTLDWVVLVVLLPGTVLCAVAWVHHRRAARAHRLDGRVGR